MTLYPPNISAWAVPVRGIPVISFNRFSFPPPPSSSSSTGGTCAEPSHATVTVTASWVGSIPTGLMRLKQTSWACCLLRWRIRQVGVPFSAVTKETLPKEHGAVPSGRLTILWIFRICGSYGGFCSNRKYIQFVCLSGSMCIVAFQSHGLFVITCFAQIRGFSLTLKALK